MVVFRSDYSLNRSSAAAYPVLIRPGVGTIAVNMELAIRIQIEELLVNSN